MAQYRCHFARNARRCQAQAAAPQSRRATIVSLGTVLFVGLIFCAACRLAAQDHPIATAQLTPNQASLPTAASPIQITLAEAEQRARKIEPTLQAAVAARGTAGYNRSIARSALLPQANILGEYLFTQSNRSTVGGFLPNTSGPVFIANNGVHEYTSQVVATETLSVANAARYRQTGALALQARAQEEIASRGLHVVVTQDYYAVEAADRKLQAAQEAQQAAQNFRDLTSKLEAGREVAHADVLKAQLQLAQAQRGVADAELLDSEARQSLGVLMFPNPATHYTLADPLDTDPGNASIHVPDESEIRALASNSNPDLRTALEALKAADADVTASRAGYLPSLSFAYNYGLDAPAFESTGPGGVKFLGYSASAAINIPIWDWFATHDRIKQSELLRNETRTALDYAQRQLIAQLNASYDELKTAAANLASLNQSAQDSKQSLHLTILQYQAGQAIALEVVTAENTEVTAKSAAADGALRYHVARANLERLTGTLP
jgi:outer membrane protein TolC